MWMSKKMVRAIAIIIALALILSILVAAGAAVFAKEDTVDVKKIVMNFSVEEAQSYAREHNFDMLIAKLNSENMEITKKINKDTVDLLDDMYKYTKNTETFDGYKNRNGYLDIVTKNAQKALELGNEITKKGIEMSVLSAYYDLSEKQKTLELKNITMDNINKQVEIAEKKLDLGNISEIEYKNVLLEKTTAQVNLNTAKIKKYTALVEFNKILNLPLDQEVNLTGEVVFKEYEFPDFEKKLEERKLQSLDYIQELMDKELLDKEVLLRKIYSGVNSKEYKKLLVNEEINNLEIQKQENELEYKLENDIKTIQSTEEGIKIAKEVLLLSKTILEVTRLRQNLGMATEVDVIDMELKNEEAESDYLKAVHGYNILILKFEKNL